MWFLLHVGVRVSVMFHLMFVHYTFSSVLGNSCPLGWPYVLVVFCLFVIMPPPFEECGRALSVAHVRPCVRPSVRPCVHLSVRLFVHHYSGYFVSATPPTILSQSF